MNDEPSDAELKLITAIAAMPLAVDRVAALRAHVARSNSALTRALTDFVENSFAPEPNCSCHINAPCSDCTDNGSLREMIANGRAAIASPELARDEIADALKLCHRLRNGAARMTKEQFNAAMHKAIGADPAYCQGVRVNFQNNPAAFLAHRTPQIQSIELLRVLLDITRQPGDDGTTP